MGGWGLAFSALASGSITSGSIASGQVGWPHLASGAVGSGTLSVTGTPNGTLFLRDDFTWQIPIGSGAVGSGSIASGAVQGFFGTIRNIASGTVGVFDFGSGAVIAGAVGSGAITSGNVASGQIGTFHIASGAVLSGTIASGAVGSFQLSSGAITSGKIGSGAVIGSLGGGALTIASGTIGPNDIGSGAVLSGAIGSGQVGQFAIASGAVSSGRLGTSNTPNGSQFLRDDFNWVGVTVLTSGSLASGSILSGNIASGQIGTNHISSGAAITYAGSLIFNTYVTTETISGVRCAMVNTSGLIQMAMAAVSGRMPATGVVFANAASGQIASIIRYGDVGGFASEMGSGVCISGRMGRSLWVGASGQVVTLSGGGPTIGVGATNSGAWGQRIGNSSASGRITVDILPQLQFSGAANITTNVQQWPI